MFEFLMPLKDFGKQRAKPSGFSNHHYTPKETKDFEAVVGAYAKIAMRDCNISITNGGVSVRLLIFREVPKSFSAEKRRKALLRQIKPLTTPDCDNVLKIVFDAMQKVLYTNDSKIPTTSHDRWYGEENSILVSVDFWDERVGWPFHGMQPYVKLHPILTP